MILVECVDERAGDLPVGVQLDHPGLREDDPGGGAQAVPAGTKQTSVYCSSSSPPPTIMSFLFS